MQELTDSIKRPNLRIMGIEEEEGQAKGMSNIIQQNNYRKFPKSRKNLCPYRCKRPPEHQTGQTKIELPHSILSLKQQIQRLRKNIEGCKRAKTNSIQR
jgi:hypothetical protein